MHSNPSPPPHFKNKLFQKQIVPKTNCSKSFGFEIAFHAPPRSTKGTVWSCAVYCVIKPSKWAVKRCCLVNRYHHLLSLFRNCGIGTSSPLNGKRKTSIHARNYYYSPYYSQQILHLDFEGVGFCWGFFSCEQIELMWLGHKVPDRSPSSDQNKLLGELRFLTLTTNSDCFTRHHVLSFCSICSLQCAGRFALSNALQKTGHSFKLLRSCLSVLWMG